MDVKEHLTSIHRAARFAQKDHAQRAIVGSDYNYDMVDNLTQLNHSTASQRGQTENRQQFSYDIMGRMTGRFEPNGSNNYESFHYDAADNLLDATQSSSTSQLLNDLFARFKQTEYSYDEFGQLKRKRGKGSDQFFTFDDEGRLIHAQGIGAHGEHSTQYHYDALGRRTAKVTSKQRNDGSQDQRTTQFIWLGMRMVQVVDDERLQARLKNRGYTSVPVRSEGNVWTKPMSDGSRLVVHVDPAISRTPARGFADEVPHAHKEVVPTSNIIAGDYGEGLQLQSMVIQIVCQQTQERFIFL